MNISKIKTLIPAPESAFHIELSNDNSQVNCDYNGSPIIGAVYESSVISLWYGGSNAWNQFNVTVSASGITHGFNANTHTLNPSAITADTATITVTARHKTRTDVVLTATYTLTKNKAGSPGATPVSYSLIPSRHVIRKDNDGTLLDTQISFVVHKRVGTALTIITTFKELFDNALDIKIGSGNNSYIGQPGVDEDIAVNTSDYWANNDDMLVRLEHDVDTSLCYDSEHIGVVTNGEDGNPSAYGLFIPAIIWVTADEDGWSVGAQSFNVTPSVVVEGVSCGFEDPLTILSSPQSVTARYNSNLGIIVISVPDGTDPADYEGEVKVSMEAIVNGETYAVIKSIPIVANRKGEQGNGIVSVTRTYAISNVGTVANDTTEPAHQGSWSNGSPAVTSAYPFLWAKEVTVYTDTSKNTTKYYCVGKMGDRGIDGAGSEWVFIRSKTEVAPVIADSEDPSGGEDSNGNHYGDDDYLPMVYTASGEVEENEIQNRGVGVFGGPNYGECTDEQKGVTETWPFEWIARRSNILNGKTRSWQSYEDATAANSYKMSLHARYSKDGDNGKDGVTYEIIPSVAHIRADENGNILTGVITVSAYKTIGENRTSCGVGVAAVAGLHGETLPYFWVQYRINGGSWTNCSNISVGSGIYAQLAYGVPASAVSTITSGIAFRLCFGTGSSSYSVVHEMGALQVVKDGQTGARGKTGRYYYYDGYFSDSKEYTATDHQAPYIAFDWTDTVTVNGVDTSVVKTSYYMLVADTNKPGSTYIAPRTTAASGVWELMETSFKFLIAQAFFTEFGKLGSAVFSGDWMISQHGTPGRTISSSEKIVLNGIVVTRNVSLSTLAGLKNANGTYKTSDSTYTSLRNYYSDAQLQTAIDHAVWAVDNDATHEQLQAMSSTSYQLFGADEDNPFKLFTPNYAVDFLAGQAYLEDASLRGVLKVKALYTVEGSVTTVSGTRMIDLEDSPGNSYVLPGNATVYLPDPAPYAGLSLTILFSAGSVLAYEAGMYMAYYTGTTSVVQNGMSFKAVHSAEGLSVLTLQAIKAYGPNSGVKWVVVGQRGILGVRSSVSGADAYQVLPDGRLLTSS